jgi:outer membrane protein TolC
MMIRRSLKAVREQLVNNLLRGIVSVAWRGCELFVVAVIFAGAAQGESTAVQDVGDYQKRLAAEGPQERASRVGIESLEVTGETHLPPLKVSSGEAEKPVVELSVEEAVVRALANSSDIRIVSFDPAIAAEDMTRAWSDFDPTVFGRFDYENADAPVNSVSDIGLRDSRVWENGIKQKNTIGSEWSVSYALVRNWDDLFTRRLSTRYEPMLLFQLKQPLLRDGWEMVNMAGVNIAKLNHVTAMTSFRQKAEEVVTQVTGAYWVLVQAKTDVDIQGHLLEKTGETFAKIKARQGIDATTLHVKQIEAAMKSREAFLLSANKRYTDVQEALIRLLADKQLSVLKEFKLTPTSQPVLKVDKPEVSEVLRTAMEANPIIAQARLGIDVAQINVDVAKQQRMPRLDLVATARVRALERGYGAANESIADGDYTGYSVGVTYEYPLGNRQREAELRRRRLERSKAISILHNISDQVAIEAKERIREIEKTQSEMQVQTEAVEAAEVYLQTLEDSELVRQNLTPEYLLVKLQAQEALAEAQRAHIKAVVDLNVAVIQLAQTEGTVFEMAQVKTSLSAGAEKES